MIEFVREMKSRFFGIFQPSGEDFGVQESLDTQYHVTTLFPDILEIHTMDLDPHRQAESPETPKELRRVGGLFGDVSQVSTIEPDPYGFETSPELPQEK